MEKKYDVQIKSFGLRIKELRAKNDLTQTQLANMAGIGERTVQRIEAGDISIGLDVIIALAEAFKMAPHKLLIDLS
jgi:transcriptional regulator with XRE-family HTH domain